MEFLNHSRKLLGKKDLCIHVDPSRSGDDVKDFRDRILRDIRKTEEETSRGLRQKRGSFGGNNNQGNGFANMFG